MATLTQQRGVKKLQQWRKTLSQTLFPHAISWKMTPTSKGKLCRGISPWIKSTNPFTWLSHTQRETWCYCYCLLHHPKRGGWRLPPCEIPSYKDDILIPRFALWECRAAAAMASHAQCTVNKSGTNPILTMIADYLLSFILNRNSKHYGMAT